MNICSRKLRRWFRQPYDATAPYVESDEFSTGVDTAMTTHKLETTEADIVYDVHGPLPTADRRPRYS